MTSSPQATFSRLREFAVEASRSSHAPYSGRHEAAVLLLSDGAWIPGVRVESASFSLTIPPLLNAVATTVAVGRSDIAAVAMSRPIRPGELAYAEAVPMLRHLEHQIPDVLHRVDGVPDVGAILQPMLPPKEVADEGWKVALAREIAGRAHVPESEFPVGCIARTNGGALMPGVNVEHPDWIYVLCAERNVLGTCVSYQMRDISDIYLTCSRDPACTPCGACRQLLVELAPSATLWMDRGDRPPLSSHVDAMLPGSFRGGLVSRRG